MKNKKGFTLVELIATIAIVGILLIISTGTIINAIDGAKSNITSAQKDLLFSTAEAYFDDNVDLSTVGSSYTICIQKDLVDNGYLEEYEISGEIELQITKDGEIITKVKAKEINEGVETNCHSE